LSAHALTFLNRYNDAKIIYLEGADARVSNDWKLFRQFVLDDFSEFKKRNIYRKDMEAIEELYKISTQP